LSLYPRNTTPTLDAGLFRQPTAEYRGAPFWAWNNRLDIPQLRRQIDAFKRMGFGGFHMHPRTGLDTEYLSDEFMDAVKACVDKAKSESMLAWLYDEDRWPSGFAGGLVTRDEKYRARCLVFTTTLGPTPPLASFDVGLTDGRLAFARRCVPGEANSSGYRTWHAYLRTSEESTWHNNQTYVDTLSRAAIQRFVEVTHERYLECVGEEFGKTVPAIFTDEPQFTHKSSLRYAEDTNDLVIPWTDDLPDTFAKAYGFRIEDHLPELFWDIYDGRPSRARYLYHDHVCERFAEAFADTIGDWCADHGIALTGHMMEEPTLGSQTRCLGEAMRSYRGFQLPGIDLLCDNREYTTAKQAQSAAHQYGRPGVLSELYGVTNWDFDFVGHKAQGDWQAALGITVRVPHLSLVSMAGEAKRDYPASISYQSPWHEEYPLVEDHFARLNTVLTRGRPVVRVGVIHPIESYWLCFGPLEQTSAEREERETAFKNITEWLLFGLVDFDFICESLLPSLNEAQSGNRFTVGEMAYDVVVVPAMRTIRATTLERLEAFAGAGGTVVFAGEVPTLVDAVPSPRPGNLAKRCPAVDMTRTAVLAAVEPYREFGARHSDGSEADSLLHQIRADGDYRHVFVCNSDKRARRDGMRLEFGGEWAVTEMGTMSGEMRPLNAAYAGGKTILAHDFPAHGSLLLTLERGRREGPGPDAPAWTEVGRLADPVPVTLSEPNVLLLDQPEYRFDGGEWQGREEILRIENAALGHFGLPGNTGSIAQPWTDRSPAPVLGTLDLRYTVDCDVAVGAPSLALEDPEHTTITVDGAVVPARVTGWWVDEAIKTVELPPLPAGTHELTLSIAYTRKSVVEAAYLLGDFGVEVRGRHARVTAPVRELAFGDWTTQGLPFYAGNVAYHCRFTASGSRMALRARRFRAPLLRACLDGADAGPIAFDPYRVEFGRLEPGDHTLDIIAYGNRFNALGMLHNANESVPWAGPGSWRVSGDDWAYEYQLRPAGILVAPTIEAAKS
jgi:hypothetical protein